MKAEVIYKKLKEITAPIHAYSDQMVAIAKWVEAEFESKTNLNNPVINDSVCSLFKSCKKPQKYKGHCKNNEIHTCYKTNNTNNIPDGFWFDDEHGTTVTVIGIVDKWCMVEDVNHEEPYVLPMEYVLAIYNESKNN